MGRETPSPSPHRTRQELFGVGSSSTINGEHPENSQPVKLQRATGLTLVANTPKGRGVFASERIPARTVIEVCPVLILDPKDAGNHISKTMLDHYTYNWPWKHGTKTQVVVLGLGSIFNHSIHAQNVAWTRDVPNECITYVALKDIEIGDELCISYGNGRLWFHDTDAKAVAMAEEEVSALSGLERIETS
jgi:hypothetical protein